MFKFLHGAGSHGQWDILFVLKVRKISDMKILLSHWFVCETFIHTIYTHTCVVNEAASFWVPQCFMFMHMIIYEQVLKDLRSNVETLQTSSCTAVLAGNMTKVESIILQLKNKPNCITDEISGTAAHFHTTNNHILSTRSTQDPWDCRFNWTQTKRCSF